MKRALLIAGGTVGGLGAVLSVTPPQLGNNGLSTLSGASAATSLPATTSNTSNSAATTASTPAATAPKAAAVTASKSTPAATTTKKKTTTSTATAAATPSASASTTTSAPAATPSKASVSGSFTGDAINVGYGMVQVKIVVSNGKITSAEAVQNPTGRSQRFSDYAIPNLKQQTLAAQSAAIQGVSGASYTSYGWYKSLISALNKAGMPTGV